MKNLNLKAFFLILVFSFSHIYCSNSLESDLNGELGYSKLNSDQTSLNDYGYKKAYYKFQNDFVDTIKTHSKAYQNQIKQIENSSHPLHTVRDILPQSIMLPMRDGVKLYTVYWASEFVRLPTVLIRSPYGPEGSENFAYIYIPFGFAVVMQNQRATGNSEGNFTYWIQASNDGYDTLKWIASQSWSNGKVFQFGISADGILSYLDMIQEQPYLHGQFMIYANSLLYLTVFQDSTAYRQNLCHAWLNIIHQFRPNASSYEEFVLQHEGFDFFWDKVTLRNLSTVNFKAVHLAGWYDIFLEPMLETFNNYDTKSSPGAFGNQKLIVDPRGHCVFWVDPNNDWFINDYLGWVWGYEYSLEIFLSASETSHLVAPIQPTIATEKYTFYVMGPFEAAYDEGIGMYWTTTSTWPKLNSTLTYFLNTNNQLTTKPPTSNHSLSLVYDPKNPVPTDGGNNLFLPCGPVDQRHLEARKDVLIFTTDPFEDNVAIFGRITATLYVSSNCTDTDFTVKISDVYPDGYSALLNDNVLRMRWRNGWLNKTLMVPGKIYKIEIPVWSTCYVLNKGHALRIAISSSNYPRFSATLNNGNLVHEGGPVYWANNTIYFGPSTPAFISIPVVSLDQIPDNVI